MKMRKEEEEEEEEKKIMVAEFGSRVRKEEEQGNTVVVGVRMDQQSREVLTWSLVKVASPGDRVIALHVLPCGSSTDMDGKCSSLISLVKAFDSIMAVYEGFCNLKQIDLKLKICRGSSIRKVLVREANSYSASKLILGVAKNDSIIGSPSISIAKYCAKKLPIQCLVMAVDNGKIVYQREAPSTSHEQEKSKGGNLSCVIASAIQHITNKNSDKVQKDQSNNLYCIWPARDQPRRNTDVSKSSIHGLESVSQIKSCSLCRTSNVLMTKEDSLALVPMKKPEAIPNPISLLICEPPQARPGWPLLRTAIMNEKKASIERSKMSVVQWAMKLPSRYSASSAEEHSDHKPESNALPNCDTGNNSISPLHPDSSTEVEVKPPEELEYLLKKYSSICKLFSYKELVRATSNFSPEKLVGKGGSSSVYKGCLSDGKELAVKILKPSEDALKEFTSEIEIITTLHHKNIISLIGFCFENNDLILVYEFLSRGSLEECLHGEQGSKVVLNWNCRHEVAIGLAEALDYLHCSNDSQPVIHRDVKSSNILLSDDFKPQLSDFGLAKWASASTSPVTCGDVAGTFGYLAPEYFMYGKVTEKIDVYAFGVVLLELLSGRKPISTGSSKNQESLVMWAKKILQEGKLKQLIDPSLGDEYDNDQMERMILAASLCIRRTPRSRPRISLILKLLQDDEDALKWAKSRANASEESDELDDDAVSPSSDIQSYINIALRDIEDDSLSLSSTEPSVDFIAANTSLEDYLQGRWSRSSSFD